MMDAISRSDFIERFAEQTGYDSDQIVELVFGLDAVDGVTSRAADNELYFCFIADNIAHPFLTFTLQDLRSNIYIEPKGLKDFMENHGLFPFEADEFLEQFKSYLDTRKTTQSSYPYGERFYADIDAVIANSDAFINMVNQFMLAIYYHD